MTLPITSNKNNRFGESEDSDIPLIQIPIPPAPPLNIPSCASANDPDSYANAVLTAAVLASTPIIHPVKLYLSQCPPNPA